VLRPGVEKGIIMKQRVVWAAMLLASAVTQAGEIIMYEHPGFKGRELMVRGYTPDINAAGFNNHNASVLVRSGTWEVCAEPNFRGFCATLQPNEYLHLDTRFNERISSAREVGSSAREGGGQVAEAGPPMRWPAGSIEMFSRAGFRGQRVMVDRNTPDLNAMRFNDRASSLIVHKGTWQLCSDGGYRGTCEVFEPGRYSDLGPLGNDISSARMMRSR
jgi:hypothetical protein